MANNKIQNVILTEEAVEVLKCCANTGLVTNENARLLGLSEKKFGELVRYGFLEEKNTVVKGRIIKIFRLSHKAAKWLKEYTAVENFYRSNPKQVYHDMLLCNYYCNLPASIRDTWINDEQIKATFNIHVDDSQPKHFSTVDAVITSEEGELMAVEVITENYKKHDISEKHEMAKNIGCKSIIEIR